MGGKRAVSQYFGIRGSKFCSPQATALAVRCFCACVKSRSRSKTFCLLPACAFIDFALSHTLIIDALSLLSRKMIHYNLLIVPLKIPFSFSFLLLNAGGYGGQNNGRVRITGNTSAVRHHHHDTRTTNGKSEESNLVDDTFNVPLLFVVVTVRTSKVQRKH